MRTKAIALVVFLLGSSGSLAADADTTANVEAETSAEAKAKADYDAAVKAAREAEAAIACAADAVSAWVADGIEACMNAYNRRRSPSTNGRDEDEAGAAPTAKASDPT